MKRIAYDYKTGTNSDNTAAVYGQILTERYWDGVSGHEHNGAAVSTLTVGMPNNNPAYRTETRADSATRTFVYTGAGYVSWASDFMGHQVDGQRHTITNAYNSDGTLQSKTDQLNHLTNYAYDDYRRLTSVTPPDRGDGTGTHTAYYLYADGAPRGFYTDTNAQPSYVLLPSGKMLRTIYDANWRKSSVTVGYTSGNDATTSYLYDGMGNVTWLSNPRTINTAFYHDERNRPSEVHDAYGNITSFQYDTAGRNKSITRPNGQTITYDTFDAMNRVTQQTATESPEPNAVTKYAYYTTADGQNAPSRFT
jgi:YD repeat-containing protein